MDNIQDMIATAKEAMPNLTPTPPGLKAEAAAHDLKARLDWGEPALTILDVRARESFNKGHIMGAMSMPVENLSEAAQTLNQVRDIYIYGGSEEETAQAASALRTAGFTNVAQLKDGLAGWKAVGGPTEGIEEISSPGPDAYNVVSRLSQHQKDQNK